ncbi:hypothetical protein [Phaeodactylibacter xiamenensis]|uniref:hypothetical protein n=1 Tax=Phaeodactylibacter xiamenensis TaxID=1524460 RepID=UPI0024A9C171|nr:hypothetical protein [Phaeodactylibacter xiamenensis]
MKKLHYLLAIVVVFLVSCVPQSDYDQLNSEKQQLERELKNLKYKYNQLLEENRQAEIAKQQIPFIPDSEVIKYIEDNYSFHERGTKYRNVQVKRIADNSFAISLELCNCGSSRDNCCSDNFFWEFVVKNLTVHPNGSYDFYTMR